MVSSSSSCSSSSDLNAFPSPSPIAFPDLSSLPSIVYNFAYGSNMNPSILTGRRRLDPRSSHPAVLFGYQLTFDLGGLPLLEPGMGNVRPQNPPSQTGKTPNQTDLHCVHGIIHELTRDDFIQLLRTESGAGERLDGYIPVLEPVITYDGRVIDAYVLVVSPSSPLISKVHVDPSNRYLNLLRTGAAHYAIDEKYIEYLRRLPHHHRTWWKTALGLFLVFSTLIFLSPLWLALVSWSYVSSGGNWSKVRGRLFATMVRPIRWTVGSFEQVRRWIVGEKPKPYSCAAFRMGTTEYDSLERYRTVMRKERRLRAGGAVAPVE